MTFAEYIRKALGDELKIADKYAAESPAVTPDALNDVFSSRRMRNPALGIA